MIENELFLVEKCVNTSPILVSIVCNTFNHANYIRNAIDSFLKQKVNFGVEILIHDDCSTDGTDLIIKEYSHKYPKLIKPIFEDKNLYSQHISISKIQAKRAVGKYIALCEGDDFWNDELKLYKQVRALEENLECSACFSSVNVLNTKTHKMVGSIPEFEMPTGIYDASQCLSISLKKYSFQTSSYFVKTSIYKEYFLNRPSFSKKFSVGDVPMFLYFISKGDIFFISQPLSTYLMFNVGSWSDKYDKLSNKQISTYKRECYMGYKAFDKETYKKFHKILKPKLHDLKWSYLFLSKKYFTLFLFDPLSVFAIIKNKVFKVEKNGK